MPTYQYECDHCHHAFEILQSMMDDKLTQCPECQQDTLHRLIGSGSGIIFKGSGFYETDYKKKRLRAQRGEIQPKQKSRRRTNPRRAGEPMDNPKSPKFLRFWFPVILYSGIIFYMSSIPNMKTPMVQWQFDKLLHILLYMPFGMLLTRAFNHVKVPFSRNTLLMIAILGSCIYGISDEAHQSFVPGRGAGIFDVVGDTIGGGIGGYLYLLMKERTGNKQK